MQQSITDYYWPVARLPEALEALGKHCRLGATTAQLEPPPPEVAAEGTARFDRWMHLAAEWLGLEVEAVEAPYPEVLQLLQRAGPALLRLPSAQFLVLAGSTRNRLALLTPEQSLVYVDPEPVRAALCEAVAAPVARDVAGILARAGIRPDPRAHALLLGELLGGAKIQTS